VVVSLLNYLKNCFSLRSQLWFFFNLSHSGFRLILTHGFVKRGGEPATVHGL
jgi:hypothetical protein